MTTSNTQPPKEPATGSGGQENPPKQTDNTAPSKTAAELAAELEAANKRISELNEESKKHRLEAKELGTKVERFDKVLKALTGKDEPPDPVAVEKARADQRIRKAYLKAATVSAVAGEAHNPEFLFDAMESKLAEVKVDLDTGEVDSAGIKAVAEKFKATHGFLFKPAGGGPNTTQPPKSQPDGNGQPAGGNPYKTWRELSTKNPAQAQEFYEKNRAAIMAHAPK